MIETQTRETQAMTIKQIEAAMNEEMDKVRLKFETAKKIRELIAEARKAWPDGVSDWDDSGLEDDILALVQDEK